ncbi:proteinase T-like protein, partial [Leptotrombidium deliense]
DNDATQIVQFLLNAGAKLLTRWEKGSEKKIGFSGIAFQVNSLFIGQVLNVVRNNCKVKHIEQDQIVSISAACEVQNSADWCLAKVSNTTETKQFLHNAECGSGSTIYIIDTGCNVNHEEFEGRDIKTLKNFVDYEPAHDLNGHGTGVASMAGGNVCGVAKQAKLRCVKVLD